MNDKVVVKDIVSKKDIKKALKRAYRLGVNDTSFLYDRYYEHHELTSEDFNNILSGLQREFKVKDPLLYKDGYADGANDLWNSFLAFHTNDIPMGNAIGTCSEDVMFRNYSPKDVLKKVRLFCMEHNIELEKVRNLFVNDSTENGDR